MADYEKMSASEVQRLAKQGDKDALLEMVWRIELMPAGDRENPVERCAWQDFWFEKAADAGNVDAKGRYARALIERVMNADARQKAMGYFQSLSDDFDAGRLSAEQREEGVLAKLWLGIILCQGYHTPHDAVKGTSLIKFADTYFKGFEGFGFKTMYHIGELYASGLAQQGEEPTIADLEQAMVYLKIAIERFNPKKNNPDMFDIAQKLYENTKQWKKTKEDLHKGLADIRSAVEGRPIAHPENTVFSGADERRRKMMELSPKEQQWVEDVKDALARLRQRLTSEGWISEYYVLFGSDRQGPISLEELVQFHQNGKFKSDTLVWKEGMEQWSRAGDCPDFQSIFEVAKKPERLVNIPPPPPTKPTVEARIQVSPSQPVVENKPPEVNKKTSKEGKNVTRTRRRWIPVVIVGVVIALVLAAGAAYYFFFYQTSETNDYSLIPVSNDGERWGYINRKGEYIINPQFEDADFFSNDGIAKIKSAGGKTGYINKKGEYVIPATYKNGTAFNEGLVFVVADGGLPTCIDKKGDTKFVLNIAKYVSAFYEGMAIFVTEDGECGYVDKTGNIVINAQYTMALPFYGGVARIVRDEDAGFIDKTGRYTVNPQFKAVGNFSEGKASFSDGKQWGYINTTGAYVINPQYDDADRFSQGLAAIKQGRSYGYINEVGRLIINPQFDHASAFSSGLAAVQSANKFGYINKDGKFEINAQFDFAGPFISNIALVRNAEKWGFINKKGQYVVNPQFKHVKMETSIDVRPDMVESDYYDTSEFIKLFFEREAGNVFDGIKASTTLEELSNHPKYGADVNARGNNYADYRQTIPVTKEISIINITFHFMNNPIYKEVTTVNNRGYRTTNRELDFAATPDAIAYQFNLSGKASEKRSVVINALKTEIERRYGQTMLKMDVGAEVYGLFQDSAKLSFAIDVSNVTLYVSFTEGYLSGLIK